MDDDEIPIIDLELAPEGDTEKPRKRPKKPPTWPTAILSRVFCFFLWLIMAWMVIFAVIGFAFALLLSIFSPRVAMRRSGIIQIMLNYIIAGLVLTVGGFIGIFSPRLALALVAGAFSLAANRGVRNPFESIWRSGMGRYR